MLKYCLLPPIFCEVCCKFFGFPRCEMFGLEFCGLWHHVLLYGDPNILEQLGASIFRFQRSLWPWKWRKHIPSKFCFTCKTAQLHTPRNCSL